MPKMMDTTIKFYSELIKIKSYDDRLAYLKLNGGIGSFTFGGKRIVNQTFYHSDKWKRFRKEIILRDKGYDLGDPYHPISGMILIHHINPITVDDIWDMRHCVLDPENVISCSRLTHNAIHYGNDETFQSIKDYSPRYENDMSPWRL